MPEIIKSIAPSDRKKTSSLSLAFKLYSIFALFALLTAAITALSEYNTRHSTELTQSIETASQAALNVERVNSMVYAVVMESRGIYMSRDPAAVKRFADGVFQRNRELTDVLAQWEKAVRPDDAERFTAFKTRIEPVSYTHLTLPTTPYV